MASPEHRVPVTAHAIATTPFQSDLASVFFSSARVPRANLGRQTANPAFALHVSPTPFVSLDYELFVTLEIANPFGIRQIHTLAQKHRVYGVQFVLLNRRSPLATSHSPLLVTPLSTAFTPNHGLSPLSTAFTQNIRGCGGHPTFFTSTTRRPSRLCVILSGFTGTCVPLRQPRAPA